MATLDTGDRKAVGATGVDPVQQRIHLTNADPNISVHSEKPRGILLLLRDFWRIFGGSPGGAPAPRTASEDGDSQEGQLTPETAGEH